MIYATWNRSGVLLAAATASLTLLLAAAPASAQAPDAADRCTPDVMRLCSEFVPDADRIVACLKKKRGQLSPSCLSALQPRGTKSGTPSKKKKRTRT